MTLGEMEDYLRKYLLSSQLEYDQLFSEADEVVAFGSRAVGVHSQNSDLDILLVTPHRGRIRAASLDFVLLSPEEVDGPFWAGSELASHIAKYGKWIKGTGEWRKCVQISDRAIIRKQQRVINIAANACERWSRLHPIFHRKYTLTVRRELQRLDLLLQGIAVEPTPMLDLRWETGETLSARLLELAAGLHQGPLALALVSKMLRSRDRV